ncbi:MerR family transcriptional regulator [Candidatus Uabimicrobium sp. HlEnr_7]|uniref:MerR family transcriptional regulator n=1 Tax=Candidatus Uabimicrobium helgolandensis TaxID=3095367 RepID=UPI003558BE9B
MLYKVKEVAEMTGITVRTLHHYDRIELLIPEQSSRAGYRLYSQKNLERLQQILFFKEIDFSLGDIKEILDSPNFDRRRALGMHKQLLLEKKKRLNCILKTIDKTLLSLTDNVVLKEHLFQGFDMNMIEEHKTKYAQEVREKWGKSKAYKECEQRTSKYNKKDWEDIQSQLTGLYQKIADNINKGPDDLEVQRTVEQLQNSFNKYFYECTTEIFRGLGKMYVSDRRFAVYFENIHPDLAIFLNEAITIYCEK